MAKKRKKQTGVSINMDLNFIHLSKEQVNDLYANQLVQTSDVSEVKKNNESSNAVKGGNEKHFMWMVNDENHFIQSDEDFHFLTEILNACHLNMNDIILINIHKTNDTLDELLLKYEPVFLILSNIPSNWHKLDSPDYSVQKKNSYSFLLTESLELIRSTKLKKSQLWLALKQMLSL